MLDCRAGKPTPQRGVALITILLLIAILIALASRIGLSNEVWIRQVGNATDLAQLRQANRAAQYWLAGVLEQDSDKVDGYTDRWALTLPTLSVGRGGSDGWIEDMQSRFNLNNLVDNEGKPVPLAREQFERLLAALELDPGIVAATVDWLDADDQPSGAWGAEDGYYLGLTPPYLAANRRFGEVGELRLVRGLSAETWNRLAPHVTALPHSTPVNINTATAPVLAAMVSSWGAPRNAIGKAESWLQRARLNPVSDVEEFAQATLAAGDIPAGLGVNTGYFMSHLRFTFGRLEYRTATLYQRHKQRAGIIWQGREFN